MIKGIIVTVLLILLVIESGVAIGVIMDEIREDEK